MKVLFLGDVVGKPGRRIITEALGELREQHKPDLICANGENAAGGLGLDPETAKELFKAGVEVITLGNHTWHRKTLFPLLDDSNSLILRPANFAAGAPGRGLQIVERGGRSIGIVNLIGRVFMPQQVDCPFQWFERAWEDSLKDLDMVIVDFHAEATSEKYAFGYFADGKASLVVGTHTHVATADERILPQGTGYITDLGMCGPYQSIIGVSTKLVVKRFRTGLPTKFEVANTPGSLSAIAACFEGARCVAIERISRLPAEAP